MRFGKLKGSTWKIVSRGWICSSEGRYVGFGWLIQSYSLLRYRKFIDNQGKPCFWSFSYRNQNVLFEQWTYVVENYYKSLGFWFFFDEVKLIIQTSRFWCTSNSKSNNAMLLIFIVISPSNRELNENCETLFGNFLAIQSFSIFLKGVHLSLHAQTCQPWINPVLLTCSLWTTKILEFL